VTWDIVKVLVGMVFCLAIANMAFTSPLKRIMGVRHMKRGSLR